MTKRALITGINGQDGVYLSELLLGKGYEVHGIIRRASMSNTGKLERMLERMGDEARGRLKLHYGDLIDGGALAALVAKVRPDEVYNLAAQSHVKVSFDNPEFTAQVDAVGTLKVLEAIRLAGLEKTCRFYQASTSELFGKVQETPQRETTPFYPRSPYGVAKIYGYWITVNYRESYGMYAVNGILFNHESPLRGEDFVTHKVTRAAARIATGLQDVLELGNMDARRDWGYAADFVEAMWLMLQQDEPKDYVISTGVQHSVRDMVRSAFKACGIELRFEGEGVDEVGIDVVTGRVLVRVNPDFFRPAEVETLVGDSTLAREELGWVPKTSFDELVANMVEYDLAEARREAYLREGGF